MPGTGPTRLYPLSLHDALPILPSFSHSFKAGRRCEPVRSRRGSDRKSTRLNSSHLGISYAVFCLKKKNEELAQCPGGETPEHLQWQGQPEEDEGVGREEAALQV